MAVAVRKSRIEAQPSENTVAEAFERAASLRIPSHDPEVFGRSGALELQRTLVEHYASKKLAGGLSPVARVAVIAIGTVALWTIVLWAVVALRG